MTARVYRADDDARRTDAVLVAVLEAHLRAAPDCGTTHHTGCACHEARRDARERELAEALQALCDCVSMPDVDEVRVECDVCRGGMEGHDATCPVGHALRVLGGGAT